MNEVRQRIYVATVSALVKYKVVFAHQRKDEKERAFGSAMVAPSLHSRFEIQSNLLGHDQLCSLLILLFSALHFPSAGCLANL
jgi:hypothetical protein